MDDPSQDAAEVFRVMTVCTGNLCRSPLAEQLLRRLLEEQPETVRAATAVSSCGTRATTGAPMDAEAAEASRRLGGAPQDHRARPSDSGEIARADLILTMGHAHRAEVARSVPAAARRSFLLVEFAALVRDNAEHPPSPPEQWRTAGVADRLRAIVHAASRRRGLLAEDPARIVPDPMGSAPDVHRAVGAQIHAAARRIVASSAALARSWDRGTARPASPPEGEHP